MPTNLPKTAAEYVRSINDCDAAGFLALFADNAVVDDVGREFRGRDAIKALSDREIFAVNVALDPVSVAELDGETLVTCKVDGDFDRTGLPDPVIIDQRIAADDGKIVRLTCRLAVS